MGTRIVVESFHDNVSQAVGYFVGVRVLEGEVRIGDSFFAPIATSKEVTFKVLRINCYNRDMSFLPTGQSGGLVFDRKKIPFPLPVEMETVEDKT